MKRIKLSKADILSALLCAMLIIPGVSVYGRLPDRIATHFDISGSPGQYVSKGFAVVGIPLVISAIQLMLCLVTNLFYQTDKRDMLNRVIRFIVPTVFYFAQLCILLYALGRIKDPTSVVCTFMAVLLVIAGNYMPKVRRNMFLGFRTPHTLRYQEVWDKTHRFAGVMCVICGIVMMPFSLMKLYSAVAVIIAVMLIIPLIYSEVVYHSVDQKKHE